MNRRSKDMAYGLLVRNERIQYLYNTDTAAEAIEMADQIAEGMNSASLASTIVQPSRYNPQDQNNTIESVDTLYSLVWRMTRINDPMPAHITRYAGNQRIELDQCGEIVSIDGQPAISAIRCEDAYMAIVHPSIVEMFSCVSIEAVGMIPDGEGTLYDRILKYHPMGEDYLIIAVSPDGVQIYQEGAA